MARATTRMYWLNRYQPFTVGKDAVAHNGRTVTTSAVTDGDKGKPMIVMYRLASRTEVLAWKALAEGFSTFSTTSLHSDFVTGKTVRFARNGALTYENELGLRDIDIGDDTTFSNKPGFDYWKGVLRLIIVS